MRDGGWSPAIGLQERVANHRKRRWSKAGVVSVTEKALQRRQVGDRKANTREPPLECSESAQTTSKPVSNVCIEVARRL